MKFIRLERDETLERAAIRLTPDPSPERVQRTVEALIKANPGLAERAGAGEELVLTVPADVQAERPTGQEGARVDVILGDVQDRVVLATNVVSERAEREEKQAAEALARLDSGEVARLARERPALAAQVAAVRGAADERAREAAAVRQLQVAALTQVRTDIMNLARLAAEGSALGALLDDLAEGTAGAVTGGTTGTGTTEKPPTGGTEGGGAVRPTTGGTTGTIEKPPGGTTGRETTGGVTPSPRPEGRVTPVTGGTTLSEKTEGTTTPARPTRTTRKTTKRAGGAKGKKKGGSK